MCECVRVFVRARHTVVVSRKTDGGRRIDRLSDAAVEWKPNPVGARACPRRERVVARRDYRRAPVLLRCTYGKKPATRRLGPRVDVDRWASRTVVVRAQGADNILRSCYYDITTTATRQKGRFVLWLFFFLLSACFLFLVRRRDNKATTRRNNKLIIIALFCRPRASSVCSAKPYGRRTRAPARRTRSSGNRLRLYRLCDTSKHAPPRYNDYFILLQ